MQSNNNNKKLKVITFTGKTFEIDYNPIMTIQQLRQQVANIDVGSPLGPDLSFIYAGRMIRSSDKKLQQFVRDDNMTIYTNAKDVHAGCFKVGGTGGNNGYGFCG